MVCMMPDVICDQQQYVSSEKHCCRSVLNCCYGGLVILVLSQLLATFKLLRKQ